MQLFMLCNPCVLMCARPLPRDTNTLDIDSHYDFSLKSFFLKKAGDSRSVNMSLLTSRNQWTSFLPRTTHTTQCFAVEMWVTPIKTQSGCSSSLLVMDCSRSHVQVLSTLAALGHFLISLRKVICRYRNVLFMWLWGSRGPRGAEENLSVR